MSSQLHSRLALAADQLEDSIRLHLDGRYASATTLAGAAEEVFGKQSERAGRSNIIQDGFEYARGIWKFFPAHAPERPFSEHSDRENATRNNLKHMRAGETEMFDADLAADSAKMIARALDNASRIGISVNGSEAFSEWFHEHIVGV